MSKKKGGGDLVSNRRAFHDYTILDTFEAGIVLVGSEVKSLKAGHGVLQDAYVLVSEGEVILKNASIAPYPQATVFNHEEKRPRKLLLHRKEISKLEKATSEKGVTIVPLGIYLKGGLIKVKIAIAKGKRDYDKRAAIKEREVKRDIEKALKRY